MDESGDNLSADDVDYERSFKGISKEKKRSLLERELETNLTTTVKSPSTNSEAPSSSRYGRARRLKNGISENIPKSPILKVLKSPKVVKSSSNLIHSPVYKMHASNSPINSEKTVLEQNFNNENESIDSGDISLQQLGSEKNKSLSVKKCPKVYIRKDLIQTKDKDAEETVALIKNMFSPARSTQSDPNNILDRSSEKYSPSTKRELSNRYLETLSVVKTLDFDDKRKKNDTDKKVALSKSELFELEAHSEYQVGDLAWARMGSYPFWPCMITREPSSGLFVKNKLFARSLRNFLHVTFFGDNGRRSWIIDSMLRPFLGQLEFEEVKAQFTSETKKRDPKLYMAFFISEKKVPLWNTSVEEAEHLLKEPKRLRVDIFTNMLESTKSYKSKSKLDKSKKITRTDSDVSLSESLYDTLFSGDDSNTNEIDKARNKNRNKSFDVSDVVTACLDNMAAKTGNSKIQRQSHMDRWLLKAKTKTPEKIQIKSNTNKDVKDKMRLPKVNVSQNSRGVQNESPEEDKVVSLSNEYNCEKKTDNISKILKVDPYINSDCDEMKDIGLEENSCNSYKSHSFTISPSIDTVSEISEICDENMKTNVTATFHKKDNTIDLYECKKNLSNEICHKSESVNSSPKDEWHLAIQDCNRKSLDKSCNELNHNFNVSLSNAEINATKSDIDIGVIECTPEKCFAVENSVINNNHTRGKEVLANKPKIMKRKLSNNKPCNQDVMVNLKEKCKSKSPICNASKLTTMDKTTDDSLNKVIINNKTKEYCESNLCYKDKSENPTTKPDIKSEAHKITSLTIESNKIKCMAQEPSTESKSRKLNLSLKKNTLISKDLDSQEVMKCEINNDNNICKVNEDLKSSIPIDSIVQNSDVNNKHLVIQTVNPSYSANKDDMCVTLESGSGRDSKQEKCVFVETNQLQEKEDLIIRSEEKAFLNSNQNKYTKITESKHSEGEILLYNTHNDNTETISSSTDDKQITDKSTETVRLSSLDIQERCDGSLTLSTTSECEVVNDNTPKTNLMTLDNSLMDNQNLKNNGVEKSMYEDLEFLKYLDLKQDSLIEEHPEMSQTEIRCYLYNTWLYENSTKSDHKKNTDFDEMIVKGILNKSSNKKLCKKITKNERKMKPSKVLTRNELVISKTSHHTSSGINLVSNEVIDIKCRDNEKQEDTVIIRNQQQTDSNENNNPIIATIIKSEDGDLSVQKMQPNLDDKNAEDNANHNSKLQKYKEFEQNLTKEDEDSKCGQNQSKDLLLKSIILPVKKYFTNKEIEKKIITEIEPTLPDILFSNVKKTKKLKSINKSTTLVSTNQVDPCSTLTKLQSGTLSKNTEPNHLSKVEYQNKDFQRYLEYNQDSVKDDHPELSNQEIITFLYKTWQYDENIKSNKKYNDNDQTSLVKGVEENDSLSKNIVDITGAKRKQKSIMTEELLQEFNNSEANKVVANESQNECDVSKNSETKEINQCWNEQSNEKQKVCKELSTNEMCDVVQCDININKINFNKSKEDIDLCLTNRQQELEKLHTRKQKDNPSEVNITIENSTNFQEKIDNNFNADIHNNYTNQNKSQNEGNDNNYNIPEVCEMALSRKKQHGKQKSVNGENLILQKDKTKAMEDQDFLRYLEMRQDSVEDEHPELSQEEITAYLYKTWLYEEKLKTDTKREDEIDQTRLVKGTDQEPLIKKGVRIKQATKEEENDESVKFKEEKSPKEKSKRSLIRPYYNEDLSDGDESVNYFEIFRPKKKVFHTNSSNTTEQNLQHGENSSMLLMEEISNVAEEASDNIDLVEMYFEQLITPKPNLFKGLIREKVCEICEKGTNLLKCKTCYNTFHVECDRNQCNTLGKDEHTPTRGKKKKKRHRGRKPKNGGETCMESECHSDERNNISDLSLSIENDKEPIIVNAADFEANFTTKMKEILDDSHNLEYEYDSGKAELHWSDSEPGKCDIVDIKLNMKRQNEIVNHTDFKCSNCEKYDIPICFVCKLPVSPKNKTEYRQKCFVPQCYKYYHLECLDHWPQTQFNGGDSRHNKKNQEHFEALSCPRHVCHTCVSDDPRGCRTRFSGDKLARCVRCPATYHSFTKCLPAGSQILTGSHIICPRHYENRPGKVPCHVNTGWCFLCALGGTLICCEYCPTSFHADCLNIEPPEGGYMCEDCETGRLPLYGEMVWVKLGHYRWWPGIILHPSQIPPNVMAVKHSQGEFVVRFFGQYDYYWVNRGRVFPFQEGDTGKVSTQKSKIDAAFSMAVEHASRACEILKNAAPNVEESQDIASSLLPPHYVKLKVNKPIGTLTTRRPDLDESSLTQCECDPNDFEPCGPYSQCLNRMLLTECGPTCRAGEKCNNRAFEKRLYPKMEPYRTPQRGWGLKALETIRAGQFVIEYVGEILDESEFRRRMQRMHDVRDENFYFLTLDKERMIDAGPKGNLARFMNHSCEPNCETQKWTVLGDVRVGLFALYDIPANSELTFNYNLESAGIEKKPCMCGAKRCSGYIGAKPKQDYPQPKKNKLQTKKIVKKRKNIELSPTQQAKPKPRLGRPAKPKELTEIEKDLLIIKNATHGAFSDSETSGRLSSVDSKDSRGVKRKGSTNTSSELTLCLKRVRTSAGVEFRID